MTRNAILILLTLLPLAATAQISPEEFTSEFVEIVRDSGAEVSIEAVEPLRLKMSAPNGSEHDVFLDNAYSLYLQDEESLHEVLNLYAASLLESVLYDESDFSASNIVPVVKDVGWLEEVFSAGNDGEAPDYIQRPFADGLVVIYAEDTPSNIRYIEEEVITEAGIDPASLAELSVENLLTKLPDIDVLGADGLYMVTAGGNYEASLLLVDDIWTKSNFDVAGDILVSIPARDALLISGTDETEQLERLVDLAKSIFDESPYRLVTTLYVRRDGQWHVHSSQTR